MIELREQKIHVRLLSLKKDEITNVQNAINKSLDLYYAFQEDKISSTYTKPQIVFSHEVLSKQKLRGYQLSASPVDIVVLVHKCEGRLFLTDRNGFYNDLLASSFQKTGGDVFLALTGNRQAPPKDSEDLVNSDVDTMANAGDQPTLLFYKQRKLIYVWNKEPSEVQQLVMAEKIIESVYKQSVLSEMDYQQSLDPRYKVSFKASFAFSNDKRKHFETQECTQSSGGSINAVNETASFRQYQFDDSPINHISISHQIKQPYKPSLNRNLSLSNSHFDDEERNGGRFNSRSFPSVPRNNSQVGGSGGFRCNVL